MANHVYSVQKHEELPEGRLCLTLLSLRHPSFHHQVTCSVVNNSGWLQLRVENTFPLADNQQPPDTRGELLYFNPQTKKASYCSLGDTM